MGSFSKFFSKFRPQVHIPLIIGGMILMIGLAFLFGFIVMLLWNWLMPEIFGLTKITYWQGWGLVILAHILFKSFPGTNEHGHNKKHSRNGFRAEFKNEIKKAFEKECEKEESEKSEEQKGDESKESSIENEKDHYEESSTENGKNDK